MYWITDLAYDSSTWTVRGNLNYVKLPFELSVPNNALGAVIIEVLHKSNNSWSRNIVIYEDSTVTVSVSDSEVLGQICFKNSNGWGGEGSIPLIKELFPTTPPSLSKLPTDATLLQANEGVINAKSVIRYKLNEIIDISNGLSNKIF